MSTHPKRRGNKKKEKKKKEEEKQRKKRKKRKKKNDACDEFRINGSKLKRTYSADPGAPTVLSAEMLMRIYRSTQGL